MSRTTRALVVLQLDGNFEFRDILLVEIYSLGICYTDLSFAIGKMPYRPNTVLGHEGAGVVLDVGVGVTLFSKGEKVLLSFSNFGGWRPDGTSTILLAKDGSFTGVGAVMNTFNVRLGSILVVFGVGFIGIVAVMLSRLDLLISLGTTYRIRSICPPYGVDYTVDYIGVPTVVRTIIDALGSKGRAATIGASGPRNYISIDIIEHLIFGKEYVGYAKGNSLPSKFIPYLIDIHAAGKLLLEKVTTVYDVKDFKQAIEDAKSGKTIKAVLRWS
ncbi:GroES-like protein [Coniochaeta ligniaria NRRL 30616]|uniref:GroES-like protein n=1 Tax=Coniochaeta ligniaria NRRL 30616 TaxID=1408157 RepID=A0A1J7J3Q1_9PEZI|nr:GroES-like protein [Coniochaeta ligniaria NRRL 30616]